MLVQCDRIQVVSDSLQGTSLLHISSAKSRVGALQMGKHLNMH